MLYTGHAKYEEGRESNHHTYPLYFLNLYLYILFIYLYKHYAIFIKPFSKNPKRMQTIQTEITLVKLRHDPCGYELILDT